MFSIIKKVLLILIIVVVVAYLVHLVVRSVKRASTMFARNKAVLLSKKEVTKGEVTTYSLTFELQDEKKTKVTYDCGKRMYESVKEGDEEMLVCGGGKLIQFGQNVNVEE